MKMQCMSVRFTVVAQDLDRAHQVIDAVLFADLAEIGDQERLALAPFRIGARRP